MKKKRDKLIDTVSLLCRKLKKKNALVAELPESVDTSRQTFDVHNS